MKFTCQECDKEILADEVGQDTYDPKTLKITRFCIECAASTGCKKVDYEIIKQMQRLESRGIKSLRVFLSKEAFESLGKPAQWRGLQVVGLTTQKSNPPLIYVEGNENT